MAFPLGNRQMSTIVGAETPDDLGKIEKLVGPAAAHVELFGTELLKCPMGEAVQSLIVDHRKGLGELCRGGARRAEAVLDDAHLLCQERLLFVIKSEMGQGSGHPAWLRNKNPLLFVPLGQRLSRRCPQQIQDFPT